MANHSDEFHQLVKHPLKFRIFLLTKLPSAYFSGVRVKEITNAGSTVTVPYKWFSTNPFRSTYFACLAMAAEMSTGILAFSSTFRRSPAVSMLVTGLQASYFKKATGLTSFKCNDGQLISEAVEKTIATGEAQTIIAHSTGYDANGETIATFQLTWSFKKKSS